MSKIYSYVITHDYGFAPNPYGGLCTLATCKPVIRRSAKVGDWLVGTGSQSLGFGNSVIYVAQVDSVCTIAEYGASPLYATKRPSAIEDETRRHGDNIYFKDERGEWIQRKNIHHNQGHTEHDLSGVNVLISRNFWYFGSSPERLPDNLLQIVKKGPGHKCDSSTETMQLLKVWLAGFSPGLSSKPISARNGGECRPSAPRPCS